jgi:hypothetical protein
MDFELLMEQVAKAEGERLLAENERLKADPTAAVPEELNRRMLTLIDGHFLEK